MPHVNRAQTETGKDGLVAELLEYLRSLPHSKWTKVWGGPMQQAGVPDILGCLRGHAFALEVKVPGEYPKPHQALQLKEWSESGAYTGCVHSLAECKAIIEQVPPEPITISYFGTETNDW